MVCTQLGSLGMFAHTAGNTAGGVLAVMFAVSLTGSFQLYVAFVHFESLSKSPLRFWSRNGMDNCVP